ncbi:MAG: hypothetical protein VXZ23_03115, partial [Pseudomonadota bacterium]|nr:hypothetical protein [Pseudomonadota bacterium]
ETLAPDLSLELSDLIKVFAEVMVQRPSIRAVLEDRAANRSEGEVTTVDDLQPLSVSLDLLPQEVDRSLQNHPRLARAVRAVKKLSLDSWFLHQNGDDHRYLQIVWVNRHNTRFVLSDERGVKQRDLSILQMASELGRSLKTLTTLEQLSLVEQTLFSKLSETKDDLSQAFADGAGDSITNFTHDIERALRRARRIGVCESAVSITVPADLPKDVVAESLTSAKLQCRCIEKPTATLLCALIDSAEPELLTATLSSALGHEASPNINIHAVDPNTVSDAAVLMNQLLEQSDPEASDPASPNNPSSITPKSLDDAIQEAQVRLDSLTHELRLQPIVRISTHEDAPLNLLTS